MRTLIFRLMVIAAAFSIVPAAAAADFPEKPVRLIVPFTAGGSTDILARVLAKGLEAKWGKPVVVENRPGGSTVIGGSVVAGAAPDGHTLMLGSDITYAINPHTMTKMAFDPLVDLAPITRLAFAPNWLVVAANSRFDSFEAFVQAASSGQQPLNVSVNTPGGYAHLVLSSWIKEHSLNISVIPYSGASKAVPDLMGGHLDGVVDVVGGTVAFAKDGRLKPLTILQKNPSGLLDGSLPHAGEAVSEVDITTSFVLFTRGGTPPERAEAIYEAVKEVMNQPEVKAKLNELALEPVLSPPAETLAFMKSENRRFEDIVANAGLNQQNGAK